MRKSELIKILNSFPDDIEINFYLLSNDKDLRENSDEDDEPLRYGGIISSGDGEGAYIDMGFINEKAFPNFNCLVCGSANTQKDLDFPETMRNCLQCGSDWNCDNDILLNGREVI